MIHLSRSRLDLRFHHEFRIARGGSPGAVSMLVELAYDGLVGRGEAVPVGTYGFTMESMAAVLDAAAERLRDADPRAVESLVGDLLEAYPTQLSAVCALDGALWDLAGQLAGQPVYRLFGLDPARAGETCMTLGLASPELLRRKADEAAEFAILKIKCGGPEDLDMVRMLREHTGKRLWVDANEGWTPARAADLAPRLADLGVELIEQPSPRDDLDGLAAVREVSPIPIIVDESCHTAADVPRLAGVCDGVNVKLHKCGGLTGARRLIAAARAHGLRVMTGCFCSSSVAMAQAAVIAPLCDWCDLDGALLVADDPFVGMTAPRGRIALPEAPGLGITPA